MKKILCCLALIFVVFVIPVSAAETDSTQSQDDAMFQEYYEQQAEDSGANDLPNYLPDDTKSQLDQMGISGVDWNSIQSIQPNSVFSENAGRRCPSSYEGIAVFAWNYDALRFAGQYENQFGRKKYGRNYESNRYIMYLYGSDYANCPVYCQTYRSHPRRFYVYAGMYSRFGGHYDC